MVKAAESAQDLIWAKAVAQEEMLATEPVNVDTPLFQILKSKMKRCRLRGSALLPKETSLKQELLIIVNIPQPLQIQKIQEECKKRAKSVKFKKGKEEFRIIMFK